MAPSLANMPDVICEPSNAGPADDEQHSSMSALPMATSPLVPTSMRSARLSSLSIPESTMSLVMSPPTYDETDGMQTTFASGSMCSLLSFPVITASFTTGSNGGYLMGDGSMPRKRCVMAVLPAMYADLISSFEKPGASQPSMRPLIVSMTRSQSSAVPPSPAYSILARTSSPLDLCPFVSAAL